MTLTAPSYAYYKSVFQGAPMPYAFVDLDLFDENIRQIVARAGDKSVRVASKSLRCVDLIRRVLEADTQFQGIMAFHPLEAVFLSQAGFDDILVAYPFWGKAHLQAVIAGLEKGATIIAMVDCPEHIQRINDIAAGSGVRFPLCLDVDMSSDYPGIHFGVYRSGVDSAEGALALAKMIGDLPNVRLDGIMGYEAQIAGVPDRGRSALLNLVIPRLKKMSIRELRARRKSVVEAIGAYRPRFVNAGGTGSLESSTQEGWVTEVTVGSGFYSPAMFDGYSNFKHAPAAAFAIEITRRPGADIYTCLGGGYVASGQAGGDKLPRPYLPPGVRLLPNEGAGEVQTPVMYRGDQALGLGDPIFFRHAKAGELCERFTHLHLVSDGRIVDTVPTYRGQGKCFI